MCDMYQEAYFSWKKKLSMGLLRRAHESMKRTHRLSGKKKVPGKTVKGHADSLLGDERTPSLLVYLKKE